MTSFDLQVNGQLYTAEAQAEMPLLWALRDLIGLTGTKFSSGMELCGSCTVLIDGEPTRSCVISLSSLAGKAAFAMASVLRPVATTAFLADRYVRLYNWQCLIR